jgi:hypothetical protein
MKRVRDVSSFLLVAVSLFVSCLFPSLAAALELNLTLAPDDFERTRTYQINPNSTTYTESLIYEATVGALKAGDRIDIHVDLLQPLLIENYPDTDFGVTMQLSKNSPPPMGIEFFTSSLTLPNLQNADTVGLQHHGWKSILTWFTQTAAIGFKPTAEVARLSEIDWTYTAPSWTPTNSSVDIDVVIFLGRADELSFPEPDHLFLTFVPEPTLPLLLASAMPTLIALRRRRPLDLCCK